MTLSGLRYIPHSPSLFELQGYPIALIMDQDRRWHIWNNGTLQSQTCNSREQAAQVVADAFYSRKAT